MKATFESETNNQQRMYINDLKGRISQLEEQLEQAKKEIQAREDMIELLSSSRQSSESEALVRLADELRIDYQDFQEAADLPMDADLGENMRLQLEDVFNVLKDSGINL